ncbi:unnamed protein product [Cuscuta campestris]|uniref:MULE transposase domain-containing protein n=1 Tax=Cuscuta campestris TaxID=132261 RepID=A0A484L5F3_9ASTE|nr:unnamed protein product [Cuscuta campestris]
MVEEWGSVSSTYIPIYVVELLEPSALQMITVAVDSSFQNGHESTITSIEQWADSLLVTPFLQELKGLEAYDLPSLCKPQITPLDLFFKEVMPPNESDGADEKECIEDDDEGSQFDGDEEECSSSVDVSLDEESQTDEELDVDADTNNRMKLGHVEEDEDGSGVIKEHHKRAGASWVATHLLEDFRSNREMNATTVKKLIFKRFNTYIPNYTCWRGLKLMRQIVEGRHEDGYKLLPQYMEVFRGRNPDSECFIRPLIGIDACHLKGPYQGILLTTMGLDGNNGQFPLAYGVADTEDETEWGFFLHGLAEGLGCSQDASSPLQVLIFLNKSVICHNKGLSTVMPRASRRICVLHFYKNFASKFPGAWFHSFFYIVANTFSEYVFKKGMEKIKEEDSEAYDWLETNEPKTHWARHKFSAALKCDDNTNNFVESFNKAIVAHKAKPTPQMLEEIRKLVGSRFEKRFSMGRSWSTKVTPYVDKKLRALAMDSRVCSEVIAAGRGEFDVLDGNTNFTNYKRLYDAIIHPIPDPCMWGTSTLSELDPPKTMKKKGRPKKHKRRDGIDDVIAKKNGQAHGTKRCSKCKQLGHNHRTCGQSRDPNGKLMKKYSRKKKKACELDKNSLDHV